MVKKQRSSVNKYNPVNHGTHGNRNEIKPN
jgi:hypothetical protein